MVPPPHAFEPLPDAMGAATSVFLVFITKHLPPEHIRASKSAQRAHRSFVMPLTSFDTPRTAGSMAVVLAFYSIGWGMEVLLTHLNLLNVEQTHSD